MLRCMSQEVGRRWSVAEKQRIVAASLERLRWFLNLPSRQNILCKQFRRARRSNHDRPQTDARQVPVMQFRSLIGPAIVRSVSKPSPVPRMVTLP